MMGKKNDKSCRKYISSQDGSLFVEIDLAGFDLSNIVLKFSNNKVIVSVKKAIDNQHSYLGKNRRIVLDDIPSNFNIEKFKWIWINGLLLLIFPLMDNQTKGLHNNRIFDSGIYPWEAWMN